jgi:hypothetical protein
VTARHRNTFQTVKGVGGWRIYSSRSGLILSGAPKLKSSKLRKLTRDDSIIKQAGLKKK